MNTDFPFEFTDGERLHPLWVRLRVELEERLQRCRCKNDGALDVHDTAMIRGKIECLKGIISLGDEPPTDG